MTNEPYVSDPDRGKTQSEIRINKSLKDGMTTQDAVELEKRRLELHSEQKKSFFGWFRR